MEKIMISINECLVYGHLMSDETKRTERNNMVKNVKRYIIV